MKTKEFIRLLRTVRKGSELDLMEQMAKNKKQKRILENQKKIPVFILNLK